MKTPLKSFAVIGGDMRQVYLANLLAAHGCNVYTYGLCEKCPIPSGTGANLPLSCSSLQEALGKGKHLILPTPMLKNGALWGDGDFENVDITALLADRTPSSFLFAGCIPDSLWQKAKAFSISCIDFMKDDDTACRNTIATTEGIIAEAIIRSPRNLTESTCLVLGYGKCGSTLVSCLKPFTHSLFVYDNNKAALARAGVHTRILTHAELAAQVTRTDFIFNTIPDKVLDAALLSKIKQDTLILDLASSPGGVDYTAAASLGVRAVLLPSLPGKYAPLSSAEILFDCIMRTLEPAKLM